MSDVPVDLVHWLVALAPLVVLLVLLAGRGWDAPQAGPIGLFLAAATAVLVFRTPFDTLATSVGVGVWDAIFVLLVVWPAMLLYRVTADAGALDALRDGIQRFSENQLFLVMAFGWVFASFLQGVAGFGVPVAVVAPLLVALGVTPTMAVVIPLIGHAWANNFGTLGVAWLATTQVVDLDAPSATALQSATMLWIANLLGGIAIAWLFGRGEAVRRAWPLVLMVSAVHGGGQLAVVAFEPALSAFVASTVALLVLYPLSRWERYSSPIPDAEELPAMEDDGGPDDDEAPTMSLTWALVPYLVLSATAAAALAIPPVKDALDSIEIGPRFEATSTGYDVDRSSDDSHAPLAVLTHPWIFLAAAALAARVIYRAKGFYRRREHSDGEEQPSIWRSTAEDAVPASVAIVAFLVLAKVLDHSGQVEVLALGMSELIPATVYAALANLIGVLGAFMTGSSTSSNVLFSDLQQTVAESGELSEPAVLAAQTSGGSIGNAISPSNIVLGAATAGAQGEEGAVLRKTLPWTVITSAAIGAATLVLL